MSRRKWFLKVVVYVFLLYVTGITAYGLYMDQRGARAWPWMALAAAIVAVGLFPGRPPSASSSGSAPHQ